jgi:hypothetical protein
MIAFSPRPDSVDSGAPSVTNNDSGAWVIKNLPGGVSGGSTATAAGLL